MSIPSRSERLALLVNLLGDEAVDLACSNLEGAALDDLNEALEGFREFPPRKEEVEFVLDDFEHYFDLALRNQAQSSESDAEAEGSDDATEGPKIFHIPEEHFDVEVEPPKKFEKPELSGDACHDLNLVHPYQVAQVLQRESPAIASVVLRNLANTHAAKTLELMPEVQRMGIFLELANPPTTKPIVVDQIIQTTLEAALEIEERQPELDSPDEMANLVRSLPKSVRGPMLEELAKKDSDLAESVKGNLFQFDDLGRMEDRDLQKVLGKCNTDILVVALQQVDEEILGRVIGNMSKRAKESLQEEMEYKANAKQEEIDAGRDEVVKILIELDAAGAITID